MCTYYLETGTDGFTELRQTRFKAERRTHHGTGHPHDVCAVGRTKEEVLGMYDLHLSGGVEGERVA